MKRVTIKDIAKLAGVSYSTVSRALSGSAEISEATRKRIMQICKEQDYRVNALAQGLSSSKTHVIGLIVPDITNPFYAEIAFVIENRAHELGYNIMLCNSNHKHTSIPELYDFMISHQVDGILLSSSSNDAADIVRKYSDIVPTILMGDSFHAANCVGINAVSSENHVGGYIAGQYLTSMGHRDILYIGYRAASIAHVHRLKGFRTALSEVGISDLTIVENHGDSSSIDVGYELAKEYFSHRGTHTAIFAVCDSVAIGVLKAAKEVNLRIPEDISLLGYDNIQYSALPTIDLSTVDQRKPTLAQTSIDTLLQVIESPDSEECQRKLIQPVLVKRSSVRKI